MERLCIIVDELGDDLDLALETCARFDVPEVELRTVDGRSWLSLEEPELVDVATRIREQGFGIPALASPIFKCPLPGESDRPGAALHGAAKSATLEDHWALLTQALERASVIEVPLIRIFSCWRVANPAEVFAPVAEIVVEAQRVAAPYPVEVALENEHDCNVATAAETIALLDAVPDLRVIWDPANHVRAGGEPTDSVLAGYGDRIAHMHIKDVGSDGKWVPLGLGLVPYEAVIEQAVAEGYGGAFSLETHCEIDGSRITASAAALVRLRAIGQRLPLGQSQ